MQINKLQITNILRSSLGKSGHGRVHYVTLPRDQRLQASDQPEEGDVQIHAGRTAEGGHQTRGATPRNQKQSHFNR